MKRLRKKLCSRAGESIAETLVALLVAAIALTMLAGMITATANLVKKSEDKMEEYYTKSEPLEKISAGSETMTLTITCVTPNISISKSVYPAKNETFQKTPVIAYRSVGGSGGGGTP